MAEREGGAEPPLSLPAPARTQGLKADLGLMASMAKRCGYRLLWRQKMDKHT